MSASAKSRLVGAILSRTYRLTRHLGDGGMAEVYAAELVDGSAGRFAIKVLLPEFRDDPQVFERFLAEGTMSARLVHPHIVRVMEAREAEDRSPYIVMELLEGVPLSAYTKDGGRVPLMQASAIVQGMLQGLSYAHSEGIVHRDLKPDNVFLARGPQGDFSVKLLDFGIAKVMDLAGGMGSRTRTGMLLGTPRYMSPEQIRNAKEVDPRSDLWSVGVMLYEMLTGRVAFPAPTEYARLTAVLTSEPESLSQIDSQFAPLEPFLRVVLSKSPQDRFPSAHDMSQALLAALNNPNPALGRFPEAIAQSPSVFPPAAASRLSSMPPPMPPPQILEGGSHGGTLASLPSDAVPERPVKVEMIAARDLAGTLPSRPPLRQPGAGLSPIWAAALTTVALLVGFAMGFVVGRLR